MTSMQKAGRILGVALLAAIVPACHDTKSKGGAAAPPPPTVVNLAPLFQGLKQIATAGGGTVLLTWDAASDDTDAPAAIRYQIFTAAASGAQNFNSPAATTTGATSAVITATVGVRIHVVVRAVDSSGASETNTVELSLLPLAASQLLFVDDSAAGPGTGTFADPFTSLQAGVLAAEALAGGAVVLVAAGNYNQQVLLSAAGTDAVQIQGGFPNWATFGATQPSGSTILASYAPATNLTVVDGTGIAQYTASQQGLVHVANTGRPTFLSGLRISEAEVVALFGVDVDLVVSGCSVRDPAAGNATEVAIKLETSAATFDNQASIVGNDLRDFAPAGTLGRGVGVEIGGATARVVIGSNFIGHSQATTAATSGIATNTSLFAITDPTSLVVPTGVTTRVLIEGNQIFRTNTDGVNLDFTPELATAAGTLSVLIRNNRIEFIDSGEGVEIEDAGFFGDGGSATFTVENNRVISTSGTGVRFDWYDTQLVDDPIDGPVTMVVKNNWLALNDNGYAQVEDILPPPAGTTSFTFEGNQAVSPESTAFEVDSAFPTAGPADGRLIFVMKNNDVDGASNGDSPDLDMDMLPGAAGLLSVTVEDEFHLGADGVPDIALITDAQMGTNPAGSAYNSTIVVRNNTLFNTSGSTSREIDIQSRVSNGISSVAVSGNAIVGAAGISVEFDSGTSDGGRGYAVVFNNRLEGGDTSDQMRYQDNTNAALGHAVYALLMNNTVRTAAESSGVRVQPDEHGIVLFARNAQGPGEVDGDDGLRLGKTGSNPGNLQIRNNIIAYHPGDGVNHDSSDMTVQFVNNTVAFNGMGGSTSDRGINASASSPFSQSFIRNSIVYRGGGGDLDDTPFLSSSFSFVGDRPATVGFGNITGDPLFLDSGPLRDLATNFKLRPGSPALAAGDPAASANNPDGTRNQMGAYGGPAAGTVGDLLPATPELPLVVLGLARPLGLAPTAPGLVDLYTGALPDDFGPADPILIVFSRPVDAATLAAGIAVSANGVPVAGAFAALDGGRCATFTPTGAVAGGSTVTVTAGPALTSAAGGPALAFPHSSSFGVLPAAVAEAEIAGPDSNDTAGTAQAIAGSPAVLRVDGTLFDDTDPGDMYSFTATAGQRFQVTVAAERIGTAAASADFSLEIRDATGATVLTSSVSGFGPLGGATSDPYVDYVVPTTGTYIVRVLPSSVAVGGPYAYQLHWFRQ